MFYFVILIFIIKCNGFRISCNFYIIIIYNLYIVYNLIFIIIALYFSIFNNISSKLLIVFLFICSF